MRTCAGDARANDAHALDGVADVRDSGASDAHPRDGLADTGDAGLCHAASGPADRTRKIVVSHPYDVSGNASADFEVFDLDQTGAITEPGVHFQLGTTTDGVIAFTPDGVVGVVAEDDGSLGVFRFDTSGAPEVVSASTTGSYYATGVVMDPSGARACILDDQTVNDPETIVTSPFDDTVLVTSAFGHALFILRPSAGRSQGPRSRCWRSCTPHGSECRRTARDGASVETGIAGEGGEAAPIKPASGRVSLANFGQMRNGRLMRSVLSLVVVGVACFAAACGAGHSRSVSADAGRTDAADAGGGSHLRDARTDGRLRDARADGRLRDARADAPLHDAQTDAATTLCTSLPLVVPTTDFFTDVSVASGIQDQNFVPNPTTPIPINDHSRLAVADINGDGWDDIVMHNLFPDPQATPPVPFEHLVFLNNKDGTFTNFSDDSGLRNIQAGSFLFGDVDNDGDEDVFAALDIPLGSNTNVLLLNDGSGHFTVKPNSGVEGIAGNTVAGSAAFADFNNDGNLDLYIANGQTEYDAPDQLFFGHGDGTFTEVTGANLPGNPAVPHNGVVVCDFDSDGDLDILVSTYGVSENYGHKILWQNDGTGSFTEVALAHGFAAQPTGNYALSTTGYGTLDEPDAGPADYDGANGFGIDCDDINGDGVDDILLATISHPVDEPNDPAERKWSDPTQILINQGATGGYSFVNEFLKRGLPFNEGEIDTGLADFDNDGRLDYAVTRDNKYEGDAPVVCDATGNNCTLAGTPYGPQQLSWLGLFHQEASGSFTSLGLVSGINDLAQDGGLPTMKAGQNMAWLDYDRDGALDLLVGARDHGGGRANHLFHNTIGASNTWIAIHLTGDGKHVNRDAIGARVTLRFPSWIVMRELKSSRGTYTSADTRTLHFGLGNLGCDYTLEVRWPDGTKLTVPGSTIPSNHFLTIDYTKGLSVQ